MGPEFACRNFLDPASEPRANIVLDPECSGLEFQEPKLGPDYGLVHFIPCFWAHPRPWAQDLPIVFVKKKIRD